MTQLCDRKCKPCGGSVKALNEREVENFTYLLQNWTLSRADVNFIFRIYKMKNFSECVNLINQIAEIAEREGHHPNLHLENYNELSVEIFTHSIKGLSENDFILAAKIDQLDQE